MTQINTQTQKYYDGTTTSGTGPSYLNDQDLKTNSFTVKDSAETFITRLDLLFIFLRSKKADSLYYDFVNTSSAQVSEYKDDLIKMCGSFNGLAKQEPSENTATTGDISLDTANSGEDFIKKLIKFRGDLTTAEGDKSLRRKARKMVSDYGKKVDDMIKNLKKINLILLDIHLYIECNYKKSSDQIVKIDPNEEIGRHQKHPDKSDLKIKTGDIYSMVRDIHTDVENLNLSLIHYGENSGNDVLGDLTQVQALDSDLGIFKEKAISAYKNFGGNGESEKTPEKPEDKTVDKSYIYNQILHIKGNIEILVSGLNRLKFSLFKILKFPERIRKSDMPKYEEAYKSVIDILLQINERKRFTGTLLKLEELEKKYKV